MSLRQRKGWEQVAGVVALTLAQLTLVIVIVKAWLSVVLGGHFSPLGAGIVFGFATLAIFVASRISADRSLILQVPLWAVTCASAVVAIVLLFKALPGRLALFAQTAVALIVFAASMFTYLWYRKRALRLSRSTRSPERP
jgi:hypothetical protein